MSLAERLGVSPLLIGLTVVGYGTSMPELVVSVDAALMGSPGIAFGNVVGSNICNSLLILGLVAVLAPIRIEPRAIARDGTFSLFAALLFIGFALTAALFTRAHGLALLAALAAMTYVTYRRERRSREPSARLRAGEAEQLHVRRRPLALSSVMILTGLAMLIGGADLFVRGTSEIARAMGISETVIGLTIVSVGTSLPELATSATAALRRRSEIAVGNVIGSNTYNILGVLGAAAVAAPIAVPEAIGARDMWLMLGALLATLLPLLIGGRMERGMGALFVALYVAYVVVLYLTNGA